MSAEPTLTVTTDFTDEFNRIISKFKSDEVLVGIPAETTNRNNDNVETNAQILATNEFGSPARNIPARPVMAIGIRNAQDEIAEQFKQAAVGALSQGLSALKPAYERAGIIASVSVKKAINDQDGIAPPSPATLDAREAAGFKGTKALIVTGQMRNAITYVVRDDI